MKTSKLLITSLLAAAAMSVPAWADDVSGDVAVSANNSTVYAMTGDTTFTFTNNPTLTGSISGAYTLTTSGDATLATGFGGTDDTRWTAGNLVVGSGTLTWGQGSTTDPATANQMKALGETISVSSGANLKIHLWTGKDLDTSTDGKVNITSKIILNGTSTLETTDGSYYFSGGIQVGDGTNAGTGTFTANWDKAIVISSLSGSGTMNFVGANTAYGAPLFSLGGNGGFSGALNVTSTSLHLTSENAASGATLNIARGASLYLDATTNNVKGLSGSGSVVAATAGNTLAIATQTGVTNTFSGTVGTSTSAVGLSVSGSGTQAFTGTSYFSTVSVADTATLNLGGTTTISDATTVTGGTLALSGTTNIGGTTTVGAGATLALSGGNVTLANAIQNSGTVTFSSGSVVEIGALGGTIFDTAQSGRFAVSETFTIATGTGSVSGLTASGIRVNGARFANTTIANDCKSVSVGGNVYNIASGSTATISEVTDAGTVDFINVLGALTGLGSTSTPTPIFGTGTVSVDTGALEYHDKTFLETFEGILNISGTGEVRLGNVAGSKLTKVSKVTVSTGGTLSFWGGTFSRAVELSGGTLKSSGRDIGFSGSVTVASASIIDSGISTITLSGAVSGTGTLTKIGAGTLVLTNSGTTTNVAFAEGNLKIAQATVNVVSTTSAGNIEFNGAGGTVVFKGTSEPAGTSYTVGTISTTTSNNYARNVTIESGATVNATSFTNSWGMGTLRVDGELNVKGALSFATGGNDNQTSNIISGDGTVKVGSLNIGNVGTYTISVNRLEIGSGGITISNNRGTGKTTYLGNTTIVVSESWSSAVSSSQKFTLNSSEGTTFELQKADGTATNAEFASIFEGTGKLIKTGAGTLTLGGRNTYSGGTTIEGGVLKVDSLGWGNKGNLGTKFTQDGTVLKDGGVLEVTAAQNTATEEAYGNGGAMRGFSVTSSEGTYRYTGAETSYIAPNLDNGVLQGNSHIGIANGATLIFDVTQDAATLEVSKVIAKTTTTGTEATTGALKKTGAGTLTLSGANLYSGGTTIEQGVLVAGSETALGTKKGVEVKSGATLNLGTDAVTVAGLSGAGTVGLAAGTTSSTLTVNSATDSTFRGDLSGAIALVKQGAGTLELSGSNTVYALSSIGGFDPGVDVQAGTVRVVQTGSNHQVFTNVSVADDATLELSTVSDIIAVNANSVVLSSSAKILVDMSNYASDADVVAVNLISASALSYAGTAINADNVGTLLGAIELKNWGDGWTQSLSYANNTLSLTMTIPEPSVFGLLAGLGALALAGTRRRRKKA